MKDKIIGASIESLRQERLKFSVDTLANKLKISKKTIYKFFPDKEALALALYEKYYVDAKEAARMRMKCGGDTVCRDLLLLYFDSKMMIRKDIFNKYKLNASIYSYTTEQNDALWEIIAPLFESGDSKQDMEANRIIIDGTFEKLCNDRINPDAVIERLVHLL